MDYVKLGELSVYIAVPLIAGVILLVVLRKKAKGNRKTRLLDQFTRSTFKNEDELSWYVAHDLIGAAGYQDCVVYKVDQKDQMCRQVAAFGPKNPDKQSILNPINIPFGRGVVGHVAGSGKLEWISDTSKDPRYVPDDDVRYSELTVPVFVNGSVVMVIDAEHKNHSWFKDTDVKFFQQIADCTSAHLLKLSQ
jgi:signal transduction protein with GAF and PtsI domain